MNQLNTTRRVFIKKTLATSVLSAVIAQAAFAHTTPLVNCSGGTTCYVVQYTAVDTTGWNACVAVLGAAPAGGACNVYPSTCANPPSGGAAMPNGLRCIGSVKPPPPEK